MMERLYQDFRYMPGVTKIQTTAEDAIQAWMRRLSGLFTYYDRTLSDERSCQVCGGNADGRRVVPCMGGDLTVGAWRGIDPTNHTIVGDQHIKISSGRDYDDCTINEGIFVGNARQSQEASVIVEEIEDD